MKFLRITSRLLLIIVILYACQPSREAQLVGKWNNLQDNSLVNIASIEFLDQQNCIIHWSGLMSMVSDKTYCHFKVIGQEIIFCENTQGTFILKQQNKDTLIGRMAMMEIQLVRTK